MGMAASQARFLQLTARRSNIEYQGQQINQQRLALANASAGLFEKMLTLAVPTPPSSQDDKYYKQGYNFTDQSDGLQKKISWTSDTVSTNDILTAVGIDVTASPPASTTLTISNATAAVGASVTVTTGTVSSAATGVGAQSETDMNKLIKTLDSSVTDAQLAEQKAIGYTNVIRNVTIEHNVYDPDGQFKTVSETGPAILQFDNLNRLLDVTMIKKNVDFSADATPSNKSGHVGEGDKLTYSSVFDDQAYADDMNKYEFQKASYDYQIERINQETKQVQVQDKSLELKMKQLDTEHNAVQTEMEAVQKVIQKNIESSFKTFA